ncbi:MAG: fibronectin type III domain-containing protein [Candidatus Aenigmatarchaeota archaeon]
MGAAGYGRCDDNDPFLVIGDMLPSDGNYDELAEDVYKNNIGFFHDGTNFVCVKAKDVEGNWGNCACVYFETDIEPPECPYNIYLDNVPNPREYLVCGNNPWLNATVCDDESPIQGGEYFIDWNFSSGIPAPWSGNWMNTLYNFTFNGLICSIIGAEVNITNLSDGTHYINLRGKDIVENWGKMIECGQNISFIKDTLPPQTTKTLNSAGGISHECTQEEINEANLPQGIQLTDGCQFVKPGTQIVLHAEDPDPQQTGEHAGNTRIHYLVWYKVNPEDEWTLETPDQAGIGEPNENITINLVKGSYHLVKYWAVDACGQEEAPHYELDIVDNKPPILTKEIGDPKIPVGTGEWYITQNTMITLNCVDDSPHPSDHVTIYYRYKVDDGEYTDWITYTGPFHFTEDSLHTLEYKCVDILGNLAGPYVEYDYVDSVPPTTAKTYGQPLVEGQGGYPKWINSSTPITLTATDGGEICAVGVDKIYWRNTVVDDSYCSDPNTYCQPIHSYESEGWNEYTGPFYKTEQSCHMIEYYSVDLLGNREQIKAQCVFVENTPPVSQKTLGTPKYECTEEEKLQYGINDCWFMTDETPIELSCSDQQPHPVDDVKIHYKIEWKMSWEDNWQTVKEETVGNYIKFYYEDLPNYESFHRLTWYCVDALGNKEQEHVELDIVDTKPPVSTKSIGEPKHECTQSEQSAYYSGLPNPTDGCYFITQQTPITLSCSDQQPHPVNHVKIYYKDWVVGQQEPEWTIVNSEQVTITKTQDSAHILKWYCVDELGNKEQLHTEYDVVDTKPPIITKTIIGSSYGNCPPEASQVSFLHTDNFEGVDNTTGLSTTDNVVNLGKSTLSILSGHGAVTGFKNGGLGNLTHRGTRGLGVYPGEIDEVDDPEKIEITFDRAYAIDYIELRSLYAGECNGGEKAHIRYYLNENLVGSEDPVGVQTGGNGIWSKSYMMPIVVDKIIFYAEKDGCSEFAVAKIGLIDECYIDGSTTIHVEATDPEPHPVNHVTCDWDYTVTDGEKQGQGQTGITPPFNITFPEESIHVLTITCRDALGNSVTDLETFIVDKTPPTTTKTYGTPLITTDGGYPKWITSQTPITLTVEDTGPHKSGIKATYYRVTLVSDDFCVSQAACEEAVGSGTWLTYTEPFTIKDDSCHLIEYYSVDNVDKAEQIKRQCVYVDNKAPISDKTIGEPKVECTEEICDWYVTQQTEINLTCSDQDPHPVNKVKIYYKIDWKENWNDPWQEGQWQENSNFVSIKYSQDSFHKLTWYCVDALGNKEQDHVEIDVVDTKPPETTKTVGKPQYPCGENCLYITSDTEITLSCSDQQPHPVDQVKIYYRYYLDETEPPEFTMVEGDKVTFKIPEDCKHIVEYYCIDALGNEEQMKSEIDNVDNKPPEIKVWVSDCAVRCGKTVKIYANVSDEKVGVKKVNITIHKGCVSTYKYQIDLVYNPETGLYEGNWTPPCWGLQEGTYYIDVEAVDHLGNKAFLDNGAFVNLDNTNPSVYDVFIGKLWIGYGDTFYVDAELRDNSLTSEYKEVCEIPYCYVKIVDNAGKVGYLQGKLEYDGNIRKCAGFVTVNDTFYEAHAELWVVAYDAADNKDYAKYEDFIGIDNAKVSEITGIDGSVWYEAGQWIYDVVATVDSSKFSAVKSCSVDVSGLSAEHTLTPEGNQCKGDIRIPVGISEGTKKLTITIITINDKTVSASVNIRIDNTPPTKTIFQPVPAYYSTVLPINVSVVDELSGVDDSKVYFNITHKECILFWCWDVNDISDILDNSNKPFYNYTVNITSLEEGVKYSLSITACDNLDHCIDPSVEFMIDRTPPTWPSGSKLTVSYSPYDKDGNVTLSWPVASDNLSGLDHYNIYVYNSTGELILSDSTNQTSYEIYDLSDGNYTFNVTAVDKAQPEGNENSGLVGSTTVNRSCEVDVTCKNPTTTTTVRTGGGGGGIGGFILPQPTTTIQPAPTTTIQSAQPTQEITTTTQPEVVPEETTTTTLPEGFTFTGLITLVAENVTYQLLIALVVIALLLFIFRHRLRSKKGQATFKVRRKKKR